MHDGALYFVQSLELGLQALAQVVSGFQRHVLADDDLHLHQQSSAAVVGFDGVQLQYQGAVVQTQPRQLAQNLGLRPPPGQKVDLFWRKGRKNNEEMNRWKKERKEICESK